MTKELSTKTLRKLLNKVLSESNSLTRSKRKAISKIAYMYSNFEEKQLTADNDIDMKKTGISGSATLLSRYERVSDLKMMPR